MAQSSRPARIWYQSFVHPVEQAPYIERLQAFLDQVAAPDIKFEVHGLDPPDRHFHALTEPQLAGTWFTGQKLRRHCWQLRKYPEAGQNTECLQQSARAEYFDCGWGSAIDCHRSFSTVDTFSPNLCSASLLPTKSIEAAAILKAIHVSSTQRRPSQGHNAAMMASNPSVSAAGPGCKISGDLISTTRS